MTICVLMGSSLHTLFCEHTENWFIKNCWGSWSVKPSRGAKYYWLSREKIGAVKKSGDVIRYKLGLLATSEANKLRDELLEQEVEILFIKPADQDDGFSSLQSLSHVQLFATPWTAARQAPLSITNSQSLLRLMSIEAVMPSNHLILCHPLFLLPLIFPSIRVFSSASVLHIRRPKYWSFSFSISSSNENSGLISLRIDWLDLLAVQGTLKSLLQHHSSEASILWHSALFMVQFLYL